MNCSPDHPREVCLSRRDWLKTTAVASLALSAAAAEPTSSPPLIIDTHQHLWNRERLKLPWLEKAPEVLQRNYEPEDYRAAVQGKRVRAIYMEVDVAPEDHVTEAEYVVGLCRQPQPQTVAAVIGGRPILESFPAYIRRFAQTGHVRGVRQVLHSDATPPGYCLQEAFVQGVRELGNLNLSFDLCMRPQELADGERLAELCPETRFILDHCGNADPLAFRPPTARGDQSPTHDPAAWRRHIEALAKRPNVICKISGVIARVPPQWDAELLAPIVNHCLDAFGPDRVVFGGDWPVCLLGAPLLSWIDALTEIIRTRPAADQEKLWSGNAQRFYRLS